LGGFNEPDFHHDRFGEIVLTNRDKRISCFETELGMIAAMPKMYVLLLTPAIHLE
jgi:hypothetical protein